MTLRQAGRFYLVFFSILSLPCLCCGGCWVGVGYPRQRFERLLKGDPDVAVAKLVCNNPPGLEGISVKDPETLDYLTKALRNSVPEGHVPIYGSSGHIAYVTVWIDGMGSVSASLEFKRLDIGNGVLVGCPDDWMFPDMYYYWVALPEPIPPPFVRIIRAAEEAEKRAAAEQSKK
jgi:hypothetical protein